MKIRLVLLITIILATFVVALVIKNAPAPATETAMERLKADGSYDSLAAAMTSARYRVEKDGERFSADNPAQKLAAKFEPNGALSIASSEHSTILRVASFGRGDAQTAVGAGRWTASESRAENRREDVGLTEYVENRPDGIEQGFIIDAKPSGDAPLSLILKTDGGLSATATADGQKVILRNDAGAEVLAYEKLRVWDANLMELTARMSTNEGAIKLEVEDAAAVYPLTIDPTFVQARKLVASDGESGDYFGRSVAISNDTVVVGAFLDDIGNASNQGSAYIFVRNGTNWTLQAKLSALDGQAFQNFGASVAINGDTVVIGAPGDDGGFGQGSIYVYVRTGNLWQLQSKVQSSDGGSGDNFGEEVAISGETIVVGAPQAPIAQNFEVGAAYVYVRSGGVWTLQRKLTASDGSEFDRFGSAVAIAGNTILVGAPDDDNLIAIDQGAAYVFSRSGTIWTQQTKLVANDGTGSDRFGERVDVANSLTGAVAVIGAPWDNPFGESGSGSAYVFERSQVGLWFQSQKFVPDVSPAGESHFGDCVKINSIGNTIAIGEANMGGGGPVRKNAIYIYGPVNSTWVRRQKLWAADGQNEDQFGSSLDLNSDTLVTGAKTTGTVGGNVGPGAAYIFSLGQKPFDFDGDGKTDFSIYRPNGNQWWFNRSSDLVTNVVSLGAAGDRLVPGDYTGDGKVDQAVWRPSNGFWYVVRSNDGSFFSFPFGANGDIPAPADYDGDGFTDPAVFRPSNATWYISRSSDSGTTIATFGASTDKPGPADYDGDNKVDIAIFRPNGLNGAEWWYSRSSNGQTSALQFGASTDKAVPGDFTGDGKDDIAFYRPSNGTWFVLRSEDNSYFSFPFGSVGDIPVAADYDGDGRFDAAVFRPSTSTWYATTAIGGTLIAQFGASGDQPVPNAFVP